MPTGFAQHVGILVGEVLYEFGVENGEKNGEKKVSAKHQKGMPVMWRSQVVGTTSKSHSEIEGFNNVFDKKYKLIGNSCQTYAIKLIDFMGLDGGVVNEYLDSIEGDY